MSDNLIARTLREKMRLCGDREFTGLLEVTARESVWVLWFVQGRLVWSKSRIHALRRWERQLSIQNPAFYQHITQPARLSYKSWSHGILLDLVKTGRFLEQPFFNMVEGLVAEDLFDIVQFGTQCYQRIGLTPSYKAVAKKVSYLPKDLLYCDRAGAKAWQAWEIWSQADLADISPDWSPVVAQAEALRSRTSAQTFQTLTKFMDGSRTLRDLAIVFKQPLTDLTKAVLPYVSEQLVTFAESSDLVPGFEHCFYPSLFVEEIDILASIKRSSASAIAPSKISQPAKLPVRKAISNGAARKTQDRSDKTVGSGSNSSAPKVVYIDDSSIDERQMSAVVKALGYRYTSISNPIHALPRLLEIKPDFIFLDLVMPIANGYEVCSQIRRISAFKETPIVIVTINDGIGDRVRARFVRASGFMGKPIMEKKVSKMLKKFLKAGDRATVPQVARRVTDRRPGNILSSP